MGAVAHYLCLGELPWAALTGAWPLLAAGVGALLASELVPSNRAVKQQGDTSKDKDSKVLTNDNCSDLHSTAIATPLTESEVATLNNWKYIGGLLHR